jgi:hypothetical protein
MSRFRILVSLALLAALAFTTSLAEAVNVRSYTRKDGTFVRAHTRSSPSRSSYSSGSSYSSAFSGFSGSYVAPSPARVAPPSSYRTTARSYTRNSARTTARSTAPTGGGYGTDTWGDDGGEIDDFGELPPPTPILELTPDPSIAIEKVARVRLSRAQSYEANGEYDKAVRDYIAVVRRWPDTESATTARENALRLRENEPFRTWRTKTGGFTLVAKFVREEERKVVLETREEKTVRIDFVKLSSGDQVYVISRRAPL